TGLFSLWTIPVAGGKPTQIAPLTQINARYSPDGRWIMYGVVDTTNKGASLDIKVVPSRGGEPVATFELPSRALEIAWTPDGKALSYLHQDHGEWNIYRHAMDGSQPTQITRLTEGTILSYRWFRDGSRLLLRRRIGGVENLWTSTADGSHLTR